MHTLQTPAKINLFLDVLNRREDGFHNIHTAFLAIDLYDQVTLLHSPVERTPGDSPLKEIQVDGPYAPGVPADERNIVSLALAQLEKEAGRELPAVEIILRKAIPHGAGLGGGSSDAAAALLLANELFALGMNAEDLKMVAERAGADCPFFIEGGAAEGAGRGELLNPLPVPRDLRLLVAWPRFAASTREAYQSLSPANMGRRSDIDGLRHWLTSQASQVPRLHNAFEEAAARRHAVIAANIQTMRRCGALIAALSGSGSSVYGVFESDDSRYHAFDNLRDSNDCFLCRPSPPRAAGG